MESLYDSDDELFDEENEIGMGGFGGETKGLFSTDTFETPEKCLENTKNKHGIDIKVRMF